MEVRCEELVSFSPVRSLDLNSWCLEVVVAFLMVAHVATVVGWSWSFWRFEERGLDLDLIGKDALKVLAWVRWAQNVWLR